MFLTLILPVSLTHSYSGNLLLKKKQLTLFLILTTTTAIAAVNTTATTTSVTTATLTETFKKNKDSKVIKYKYNKKKIIFE